MFGGTSRAAIVRDTLFGIGLGAVVGGVGLGIYSRWFADAVVVEDRWHEVPVEGVAERIAQWSLVGGAVVLFTVVITRLVPWVARRTGAVRDSWLVRAVVVAVALAVVYVLIRTRWWSVYAEVRRDYPYFPQLPTAGAAAVLVFGGAVAMTAWMFQTSARAGRAVVASGLVIGLGVSVAVTTGAVHAGDDGANIDRTTAAPAEIRPLPARLGDEKFHVHVDAAEYFEYHETPNVVAAGAGFVVGDERGLTAYDGQTGAERWHYRRTPQDGNLLSQSDSALRSAADDVVLTYWSGTGRAAFDSLTGEKLWEDSEYIRDNSMIEWDAVDTAPGGPLLLSDAGTLARYDSRAGEQVWATQLLPADCGDSNGAYSQAHVADQAIYRADRCSTAEQTWWHLTATDPETGKVMAVRDIGREAGNIEQLLLEGYRNTVDVSWYDPTGEGRNRFRIVQPADLASTEPRWSNSEDEAMVIDADGNDILTSRSVKRGDSGTISTVTAPDGTVRYVLDDRGYRSDRARREFLPEQIVEAEAEAGGAVTVRTWDRHDGASTAERRADHCPVPDTVLAVPGSTLVVCTSEDGNAVDVIGFN